MRLPYKSTEDRDSFYEKAWFVSLDDSEKKAVRHMAECYIEPEMRGGDVCYFRIGGQDHKLAMKLVAAGTDHSKFMRMIHCQVMVKAPLYWWKQMDTYKVATVSNSESTMHTITKKEFELDDFSHDPLQPYTVHTLAGNSMVVYLDRYLRNTVDDLNFLRNKYLETKNKDVWTAIIQLLPSSYNQVRMLDLNYQTLRGIYQARKDHKLGEWHDFCEWIEGLPYSELITGKMKGDD